MALADEFAFEPGQHLTLRATILAAPIRMDRNEGGVTEFNHEEQVSRRQAAERLADIAFALTAGGTLELRTAGEHVRVPVAEDVREGYVSAEVAREVYRVALDGSGDQLLTKFEADVIDGPQSVVWDEAENRMHVQNAILVLLAGSRKVGAKSAPAVRTGRA